MGPGASILLRHALTEEQLTDLEQWLRSISSSSLEGQRGDWKFWVKDVQLIGLLDDCREAHPFGLATPSMEFKWEQDFLNEEDGSVDADIWIELQEEREQWLQHLGFIPEQNITIYAGCNHPIDHRILGQLVLLLAERYDGIINLEGALYPPDEPGRDLFDVTIEEVEQYVKELPLPGRIFHMYYSTGRNTRWLYHLVDADFLRAWLQHPQFHMIK